MCVSFLCFIVILFRVVDSALVQPQDEQNEGPARGIKVAEELPTMLDVEILSSKTKVSAAVDGATVSIVH